MKEQNQTISENHDEKKNFNFESALEKLQLTVRKLESGELSLEDSLKCYEEGVKLTRLCQGYLQNAEQKIEFLNKNLQLDSTSLPQT